MSKFPVMRKDGWFHCSGCLTTKAAGEYGTRQRKKNDDVRRCYDCAKISKPVPGAKETVAAPGNDDLAYMRTPQAYRDEMHRRGESSKLWLTYPRHSREFRYYTNVLGNSEQQREVRRRRTLMQTYRRRKRKWGKDKTRICPPCPCFTRPRTSFTPTRTNWGLPDPALHPGLEGAAGDSDRDDDPDDSGLGSTPGLGSSSDTSSASDTESSAIDTASGLVSFYSDTDDAPRSSPRAHARAQVALAITSAQQKAWAGLTKHVSQPCLGIVLAYVGGKLLGAHRMGEEPQYTKSGDIIIRGLESLPASSVAINTSTPLMDLGLDSFASTRLMLPRAHARTFVCDLITSSVC